MIGAGLLCLSCGGFAVWPSLTGLLIFTALLGLGHLMLVISQQILCATDPTPGALERNIGNYMVANAIGQGLGPAIVGYVGGDASLPPTQWLFTAGFLGIVPDVRRVARAAAGRAAQAEGRRNPIRCRCAISCACRASA